MTQNMTSKSPLKLIISFCVPIMLGTLFQQFYSMADTIIVGRFVGVNALAGVGSTGAVNFLILGFANGVCGGFAIMYGQRFGAADYSGMRRYIANAIYLTVFIALLLTPLTVIFCRDILMFMNTPAEIMDEAYQYIVIIFAGTAVLMMYNCAAAILRSIGDSRTPVLALIIAAVINILLDLLFIVSFGMGVAGAALATVIAQGISGVICVFFMFRKYKVLRFKRSEWLVDFQKIRRLLAVGIPMALQFSITAVGNMILQAAVNRLGAACVAAMVAGSRVFSFFGSGMESVGLTMSTYCSQNIGAKKFGRIRQGIRCAVLIEVAFSVFALIVLYLFGTKLALLFVDSAQQEIMELIRVFLRINSLFYILLGLLYVFRNSIQGMGYGALPMFSGVFELAGRCIVAFGLADKMGFTGVALANPIAWFGADLLLLGVYIYIRQNVLIHRRKLPPGIV